jgi:peptide/nickel transport system ATP-binding protein
MVQSLSVAIGDGGHQVVRDVSFNIEPGEAYGLVGESGSGKTMTSRAILGLLPLGARAAGSIRYGSTEVVGASDRDLNGLRGARIGMIFQDPGSFLNPLLRVGNAIAQVVRSHSQLSRREAKRVAVETMGRVGIRDAAARSRDHPHQFSGGMQQRVLIAMALAAKPTLLLADEPTTALDVVVQADILRLLARLRHEEGMSLLMVSHDLAVVGALCSRIGVMYAGQLVEEGPTAEILRRPRHPYTRGLIESLPESAESGPLPSIPGSHPEASAVPSGCAFAPRCALATPECAASPVPLIRLDEAHVTRCLRHQLLDTSLQPPPAIERVLEGEHG